MSMKFSMCFRMRRHLLPHIKTAALILTVMLICGFYSQSIRTSDGAVQYDITGECSITVGEGDGALLTDHQISTYWQPKSESELFVHVPDTEAAGYIQIDWFSEPKDYSITQKDRFNYLISSYKPNRSVAKIIDVYPIDKSTESVEIKTSSAIAAITVYSAKTPPEALMMWEPPEEKVTLMLISAHQDDEFIFMGGILPMYSVEGNVPTSVIYMANCGRTRREEALNGLWRIGIRNYPLFLNFVDKRTETMEECCKLWGEDTAVGKLVSAIRRLKPEVIVTHDLNGEYGHAAHKFTAYAVQRAVKLASDPSAFPESATAYGIWQVKKLYLHLYQENQVRLDYSRNLTKYGGKTALEAAAEGYAEHKSQQRYYQVESGGPYDNSVFGLAFSTVGDDTMKNDLLENISAPVTLHIRRISTNSKKSEQQNVGDRVSTTDTRKHIYVILAAVIAVLLDVMLNLRFVNALIHRKKD